MQTKSHLGTEKTKNQLKTSFCSLDPGIRTFQTIYSPSGIVYKIGDKDIGRLLRLQHHLSKIRSKIDSNKSSRKKSILEKAYYKLNSKIKNLVSELHNKTINFLVKNFESVIIPDTNIKNMVTKKNRNLGKNNVKGMLLFSHYQFRTRLLMKSSIIENFNVIVNGEEYTTKTCGKCGLLNQTIGSKKIFKCSCGLLIDRDINGSRNILLKYLTERAYSIK